MNGATTLPANGATDHATETVKRSRTSFAAGMAILPRPRREGMHAIYAFCREVDDIADDDGLSRDERITRLAGWRSEIDRVYGGEATTPTGKALVGPVRTFDLPKAEFLMMIEGMEMDARGPVVAPPMETLLAYTRRVAGSVGLLSMPIFGAPKGDASDRFALSLGDALQLTNILRDVGEDAGIGRLYLPLELLRKHGAPMKPGAIVGSMGLAGVAGELGEIAAAKFGKAREELSRLDWRVVRPALMMMGAYEAYLDRMRARGWSRTGEPLVVSRIEKALIAARWYVAPRLRRDGGVA